MLPTLIELSLFIICCTLYFYTAIESRQLHHQNSSALQKQFGLTRESTHQIVKQGHQCQIHLPVLYYGVNPRELLPNHIWQMDVTHVLSF